MFRKSPEVHTSELGKQTAYPEVAATIFWVKAIIAYDWVACAGAIRQIVADDPFAQRVVTALAPTLGPIMQYAARTPFFSNIITAIASSDDPVVGLLASAADLWGVLLVVCMLCYSLESTSLDTIRQSNLVKG